MESNYLTDLKTRLDSLAVFRGLLSDPVLSDLRDYLENPTVSGYSRFVAGLYNTAEGALGEYIKDLCENSENIYVRTVGRGMPVPEHISRCVNSELDVLKEVSSLTSEILRAPLRFQGFLPEIPQSDVDLRESFDYRVKNIGRYGYGIYAKNRMFYVDDDGGVIPVNNPDPTRLCDLVDYERERGIIIDNTHALLEGKPAANILLTGDAGTGKSSTVKAIGNEMFKDGLRIVEVRKDQLRAIPKILEQLSQNPLKFIMFIDDLSFLQDDDNFNALKAVLEGSVSAKSKNVVIYATSNRRHIVKESFSDREGDEIHRNDTMQELISLSERFGIHVTFQKPDKHTFLKIVHHLAENSGVNMPEEELELKAERFALERGGRSARLARQFIDGILSSEN